MLKEHSDNEIIILIDKIEMIEIAYVLPNSINKCLKFFFYLFDEVDFSKYTVNYIIKF